MKVSRPWPVAVFCLGLLVSALPCSASSIKNVRTGSGYGPLDTTTPNPYMDCLNSTEPCIGYINAPTFTVNGTSYPGQFYSFMDGAGDTGNFDLIDIGNTSSFSLPLADLSKESGVFSCGTGQDSEMNPLTGLDCTPASLANSFTVSTNGNSEIFAFQGSGNWVVYTVDGNLGTAAVATPEPSSLLLLLTGGLGLLLLAYRR